MKKEPSNSWSEKIKATLESRKSLSTSKGTSSQSKLKNPVRPFKPNGKKPVMRPK